MLHLFLTAVALISVMANNGRSITQDNSGTVGVVDEDTVVFGLVVGKTASTTGMVMVCMGLQSLSVPRKM